MRPTKFIMSSLALLLALALSLTPLHVLETEPIVIDSFGVWTLEELGYSDLIFPCEEDIETISIDYILPENATQGPENWYVIHLNFLIEFNEQSEDGRCYVSALTNDYSCAQIEFETKRVDNSLIIDWNTVDVLNGDIAYSTSSLSMNVSFSNYLQISGVKPGLNILTFKLEQYEGVEVGNLRVFDDSGIEYTPLSLPNLVMDVDLPESSVEVGDTFTIRFVVQNTGDLPAKEVVVRVLYPEQTLELIGEASYSVQSLGTSIEGCFEFRALTEGQHEVIIDVQTKSGIRRPSAHIEVPVGPAGSPSFTIPIIASIILGLLAGYLLIKRLRRT